MIQNVGLTPPVIGTCPMTNAHIHQQLKYQPPPHITTTPGFILRTRRYLYQGATTPTLPLQTPALYHLGDLAQGIARTTGLPAPQLRTTIKPLLATLGLSPPKRTQLGHIIQFDLLDLYPLDELAKNLGISPQELIVKNQEIRQDSLKPQHYPYPLLTPNAPGYDDSHHLQLTPPTPSEVCNVQYRLLSQHQNQAFKTHPNRQAPTKPEPTPPHAESSPIHVKLGWGQ